MRAVNHSFLARRVIMDVYLVWYSSLGSAVLMDAAEFWAFSRTIASSDLFVVAVVVVGHDLIKIICHSVACAIPNP